MCRVSKASDELSVLESRPEIFSGFRGCLAEFRVDAFGVRVFLVFGWRPLLA